MKATTKLYGKRLVEILRRFNTLRQFSSECVLTVSQDKKTLQVNSSNYYSKWLRHHCFCPECRASTGQKTVALNLLRGQILIQDAQIKNDLVLINWSSSEGEPHSGHIGIDWLLKNNYSRETLEKKNELMQPTISKSLKRMSYKEVTSSKEGLWKWLYNINETGACLLQDVPTNEEHTRKMTEKISFPQKTIYEEIFEVESKPHPTNIAYTTEGLVLHMDLVYHQSPPGIQILHCYRNDPCVEGGESLLLDGLAAVKQLKESHPEEFLTLTKIPATFQKIHFERDKPVLMIYRQPHIVLDTTGRVVRINWAPPFEGPLLLSESEMNEYYNAYCTFHKIITNSPYKLTHLLTPGDLLAFNNLRVLHGRTDISLNNGTRYLKGAYVNIDEFQNKFNVLCRDLKKEETAKHVLNASIRGGRADAPIYHRIVQILQKYGTVLTEHVGDLNMDESGENIRLTDKGIHDRDMDWIKSTHVLVAEVTQPSLGVGYEIGRCVALNKKILCLFRPESGRKLSAMIRGAEDGTLVQVMDYEVKDIEEILDNYFKNNK